MQQQTTNILLSWRDLLYGADSSGKRFGTNILSVISCFWALSFFCLKCLIHMGVAWLLCLCQCSRVCRPFCHSRFLRDREAEIFISSWKENHLLLETLVCLCCIQKRKLCISAAWVQSDLFIRLTAHLKFLSWSCLMTFKRDINKVKTGTCESPVAVHHLQLQLCFDFCTFSPTRILAFWPLQVLDVYMESKCQSKQLSLQQLSE